MTVFESLQGIKDHRRDHGKKYGLAEVIFGSILAMLSGATSYRKIHTYFSKRFSVLQEILGLTWKRVPAYTSIRDILQGVKSTELEVAFRKYMDSIEPKKENGIHLSCDGKVLRGSFDHFEDQKAIQMLSVFCVEQGVTLAHFQIAEKTNEIPAFQELIEELDLSGKVWTADAMHCQKKQ